MNTGVSYLSLHGIKAIRSLTNSSLPSNSSTMSDTTSASSKATFPATLPQLVSDAISMPLHPVAILVFSKAIQAMNAVSIKALVPCTLDVLANN